MGMGLVEERYFSPHSRLGMKSLRTLDINTDTSNNNNDRCGNGIVEESHLSPHSRFGMKFLHNNLTCTVITLALV